jgi:hypothetical protein
MEDLSIGGNIILKSILEYEGVDWINLAQDMGQGWDGVNMAMNPPNP